MLYSLIESEAGKYYMGRANTIPLLCDITKIVNSSNSLETIISDVAKHCTLSLELDKMIIYSYDINSELLVQKAISGQKKIEVETMKSPINDLELTEVNLTSVISINRCIQIKVPIMWNGNLCGLIDLTFTNERNELLFIIIASLLAPKIFEFQKPKREFKEDNKYYGRLIEMLENEKLYKDENLNLKEIARKLDLSASYLSQIINKLSKKSFSTLINEYRIQEVIEAFQEGKQKRYSILAIAFDAGFSSKSTFNAVFKNVLGCSPSKYLKEYV